MVAEMHGAHSNETQEQFVRRASNVFPEEIVSAWSRIERAVFNQLMARLIHRCGYSAITNEMLQKSRKKMERIVRNLGAGQLAH